MEIIDLKFKLLDKYGDARDKKSIDFCREAYTFLVEGDIGKLAGINVNTGEVFIERMPITSTSSEPVAVDLGLPSGTLWCDRNVGAKSPEDYGALFSWGNTEPHYPNRDELDWGDVDENCFDYSFDEDTYEKTEGSKLEGDIDLSHDAARVNMGEPWKMPTTDDFKELVEHCQWIRKTVKGINGYRVSSKVNGNSIFFPASGSGNGTAWYDRGAGGYYWSLSFSPDKEGRDLFFYSDCVRPQDMYIRYFGSSVRPVQHLFAK